MRWMDAAFVGWVAEADHGDEIDDHIYCLDSFMSMPPPLRNEGPRVFLSYSFADRGSAEVVRDALVSRGCQVRMEDEASLLGQQLSRVLPERIRDAEVFVQLVTETSSSSMWVQREFEWAAERHNESGLPFVIPVVLDAAVPQGLVNEWAYVNARGGLNDAVLRAIANGCLNAVEPLPLDRERPFHFDQLGVLDLLQKAGAPLRRIVVDADGVFETAARAAIDWTERQSGEHRDAFVVQETRRRDRLTRLLRHADLVLPRLLRELHEQYHEYAYAFPRRALEPVNRFSRLLLGTELIAIYRTFNGQLEPLDPVAPVLHEALERVHGAQSCSPGDSGIGEVYWGLGEQPGTLVELGLAGRVPVNLYLPVQTVAGDRETAMRLGDPPDTIVRPEHWADFALPQIARKAAWSLNSTHPPADIIGHYGWKVSDYRRMGYP